MKDLTPNNIKITPADESKFVKLHKMEYSQNEIDKRWDFVKVHDSVAIVLADMEKQELIMVKQFRPPVFLRNDNGFTYELCAGITDKDIPLVNIAQEEILEETGYDVRAEDIERISEFFTAVSFAGSKQTLYYAEVNDSMKKTNGGGVGTEMLEIVTMPFDDIEGFIYDESRPKTPGLMFALIWFSQHKLKQQKSRPK
jgi:UDP-sugar diphosphatase